MAHTNEHHDHDAHSPAHYVKIWGVLLVLLVISIAGPEIAPHLGSAGLYVLLFTAFGIAFVKAWLVIKHFMHLTIEQSWVGYILITCLVFLVLFLAGTAPDVYNHEGTNWENQAAKAEIARVLEEHAGNDAHGEHGDHADHGDHAAPDEKVEEPMVDQVKKVAEKPAAATYADQKTDADKKSYLMKRGEALYAEKLCVTCHRSNGAGHGQFPPLVGQKDFMGDCAKTLDIINNGMNEPIVIEGVTYTMPMPATKVTPEEGAAIATYIRNSWGNDYGVCTP